MLEFIKREPAVLLGLVQAVLALVLSFGLHITEEQMGAILAVTAFVLAIVTRQAVTPLPPKAPAK